MMKKKENFWEKKFSRKCFQGYVEMQFWYNAVNKLFAKVQQFQRIVQKQWLLSTKNVLSTYRSDE